MEKLIFNVWYVDSYWESEKYAKWRARMLKKIAKENNVKNRTKIVPLCGSYCIYEKKIK